jgi:hypothetical protein
VLTIKLSEIAPLFAYPAEEVVNPAALICQEKQRKQNKKRNNIFLFI